jgi:serine phosphatase RsbU (regulator of sigma subunit)
MYETNKKWAYHAPMNYLHKYHLVEAEIARVNGQKLKAIEHYQRAIALANEHKFLQEEALSLELTAKFWLELGDEKIAGLFIAESYNTYHKWGATAKIKHLEDTYKRLFASSKAIGKSRTIKGQINSSTLISDVYEGLDLSSIMESANAFVSTLNRKELLKRVIEIAVKNAGATHGFLLIKRDEHFFIDVELDAEGHVSMAHPQSLDSSSHLAVSVVNYVIHTKNHIVLDDAANQGDFTTDPWIKNNQVKSVIASALLLQGELTGIFYAENNIVNGAFTEDRLETLKMLSTQAAISIKNAQLFENIKKAESDLRELNISLEKRVEDRTEKLNQTLKEVEEANTQIMSSISYASVIQNSLLPDPTQIAAILPNSFFIWKPRDIIGGDIYYFDNSGDNFILAVVDCTGHGVPGAFMTMIASSGLRRIVNEDGTFNPASVLKKLNYIVKTSLQQDKKYSSSDDGLDAGICFYDATSDQLTFSGAKLSLYYANDDELTIIKGDKTSIGYVSSDLDYEFTLHTVDNASDNHFYMTSDGYIDQIGGERNRRMGSVAFKRLIMDNYKKPFETQRDIFNMAFEKHQGDNTRTDDVIVTGFNP